MNNNSTLYTFSRFPSRKEAVEILNSLIQSGVLSEEMVENLKEIKVCIENERQGLDLFGAAHDNVAPLFVTLRAPESRDTEEYRALYQAHTDRVKGIRERYHMIPRFDPILTAGKGSGDAVDDCEVVKQEAFV